VSSILRGKYFLFFIVLTLLSEFSAISQTVAVSANAQYVAEDLVKAFQNETGVQIETVVGSSGTLSAQISKGAPFDIFLSADTGYPASLWRNGFAVDSPNVYAFGTLVMWTANGTDLDKGMQSVVSDNVRKIAIANPRNAPYGVAAVEALKKNNVWQSAESKIIYGESIAKNVDIGFTSASVVLSDQLRSKGIWKEVDRSSYSPIPQAAILVKKSSADAKKFYNFIFSAKAKKIFQRYGYLVP
jgi:molybdate transport system substrate-binding protein